MFPYFLPGNCLFFPCFDPTIIIPFKKFCYNSDQSFTNFILLFFSSVSQISITVSQRKRKHSVQFVNLYLLITFKPITFWINCLFFSPLFVTYLPLFLVSTHDGKLVFFLSYLIVTVPLYICLFLTLENSCFILPFSTLTCNVSFYIVQIFSHCPLIVSSD